MEDQRDNPNIIGSEIIIYQTEDGYTKIDVKFEDETVWLTQAQLCELYQTSKSNISEHIKHIFEEEELDEESVVRKFRTTAADGKNYNTITINDIRSKVYIIRGQQVMLDKDLAEIYGYEVKKLNQQVKRNIERFPEDFMFRLSNSGIDSVRSQIVTSRKKDFFAGQEGGRRYLPYAFTEQGIYILKSSDRIFM